MTEPPSVVVVTDANLLINLIHTSRLALLGRLPGLRFVVPDEVVEEVSYENQRITLAKAIAAGTLTTCALTYPEGLRLFAELRVVLGAGEAVCLVLARSNGWHIASDERRRFRRELIERLGEGRLVTTPSIYVRAMRAGRLTVAEADADKGLLASRRFVMKFGSFAELLADQPE